MKPCPKCGMIINNNEKECPKCHTNFVNEEVEILELPKIKDSVPLSSQETIELPKKKTEKTPENNSETIKKDNKKIENKEFIPEEIPLTVKKTTNNKKNKSLSDEEIDDYIQKKRLTLNKYYNENTNLTNISSMVKITTVILILILTIAIIVNIVLEDEKIPVIVETSNFIQEKSNLFSGWRTDNDSLFNFNDDLSFYWYEDYETKDNNYYAGTYTYKSGLEALAEMGYSEDDFIKEFGDEFTTVDVYSIEMTPTIAYIEGKDVSEKKLEKNIKWWYILLIKKDGSAISYNKTLDIRYNLYNIGTE